MGERTNERTARRTNNDRIDNELTCERNCECINILFVDINLNVFVVLVHRKKNLRQQQQKNKRERTSSTARTCMEKKNAGKSIKCTYPLKCVREFSRRRISLQKKIISFTTIHRFSFAYMHESIQPTPVDICSSFFSVDFFTVRFMLAWPTVCLPAN